MVMTTKDGRISRVARWSEDGLVIVGKVGRSQDRTPIRNNLNELFEAFLIDKQRPHTGAKLAASTVRSYNLARKVFSSALDATDEEALADAIDSVIDRLLEPSQGKALKGSALNVYLRSINSFFSWCHESRFLDHRLKIELVRSEARPRPRILTDEQIQQWQRFTCVNLGQLRAKYMGLLILDTGLRAEECLMIRERDIEWAGSRIWIGHGKGDKPRAVPLSGTGKKALRRFLSLTYDCRETLDKDLAPLFSFVFCTELGKKMSYRNALRDLKSIADRLGMGWAAWHTFRRTFATVYLCKGGLLTHLQEILGHEDVRTTIMYLGSSIEGIVEVHDEHSPLSQVGNSATGRSTETGSAGMREIKSAAHLRKRR